MTPKYTISVQCTFSASHTLPGCPPCDRLHGHTWTLRASWSFEKLGERGMGADFSTLKRLLEERVTGVYDHRHLNEVAPFDTVVPTAENLAREFYAILKEETGRMGGGVLEMVEVREGPENSVSYRE